MTSRYSSSGESRSLEELESFLRPLLYGVITGTRSTAKLAKNLLQLSYVQQNHLFRWIEVIVNTNTELAFQLARHAPRACRLLDANEIDQWILQVMHTYDHHGLFAAAREIEQIDRYLNNRHRRRQVVSLDSVNTVLEKFVQGLHGRRLIIEPDEFNDRGWTDTETIYLPRQVAMFARRQDNFSVYKCAAALLWAQTRFGTYALMSDGANDGAHNGQLLIRELEHYDQTEVAIALFLYLETQRLLYQIEVELPGLAREMHALAEQANPPDHWLQSISTLQSKEATVRQSLQAVANLYPDKPPAPACFQGILRLPITEQVISARIDRQRDQLRQSLAELIPAQRTGASHEHDAANPELVEIRAAPGPNNEGSEFELSFNGKNLVPSAQTMALLQSITQDLGTIPLDYLNAAGPSDNNMSSARIEVPDSDDVAISGEPYPEWDFRRGHYRQDWCFLRELDVEEGPADFVSRTLNKYASVLPQLRKTFEALKGEDKRLRRQLDGDDIDLDSLVESLSDMHRGMELSDRLYTRMSRIDRNIAVMFMIDMSGSTKGWVNDAERESLVLLCQALEILGDRYAIYGFSGMTRKRCELFHIKQFDEDYSETVERRISGIKAKDYTRMGVTIRHLNKMLEQVAAKTKLLITLSDGKPEDFDGYGGEYGIEDTRQALIETRRLGIHPFCITIDTEASTYLPHMFGLNSYAVVNDVHALPLKVADVYRRLTL